MAEDLLLKAELLAPAFCLMDTTDRQVCLADYAGRQHVVLVFNRGFA